MQVIVCFNGRPVDAVKEYITVASVRGLLDAFRPRGVGENFRDCEVCPEMVVIPPGEYMMGSPPEEKGRGGDEGPHRKVRIGTKLSVGRYEVTRQEYAVFV